MNDPIALTAIILWLVLLLLTVRTLRKWKKEHRQPTIFQKNHPSIPVKVYKLSEFTDEPETVTKPISSTADTKAQRRSQRMEALRHAWDQN
ncbi:hypothetical protein [Tunicatimonas pelagia]|uniref:hypothetical protein n=1 Tax=Tunicatimonas pelagia TaxID=931531 RepID=UPI0026651408|nr:hypothetical protein [Tunicatimonas pelagia]WKN44917.1 hypothetical protein P0M28_08070 [Tunicatimonas pelagia]